MPLHQITLALLLLAILIGAVSQWLRIPYPIALVLAGALLGFVPGLPQYSFDPQFLLMLVLPPILYQAGFTTSWRDFKANLRPIGLLAVGLVVVTTLTVGAGLKFMVPDVPWAVAFAFGAIVSPPDAVAATAILSRLNMPRRLVTILEGESLVNDASGLVLYKFAVAAALTGAFSLLDATGQFVLVAAGGIALGLGIARLSVPATRRLQEPLLQAMLSLAIPYCAYVLAEFLHLSGVLAVVAAGLLRARYATSIATPQSRIVVIAMWNIFVFLLNTFIFMLIGLQLSGIWERLSGYGLGELIGASAALTAIAVAVRFLWVFSATHLPHTVFRAFAVSNHPPLPIAHVMVASWCGMRGIVSLAVALALPSALPDGQAFPHRDLIIFLTFAVIFLTLVGQGLTLSILIRALKVGTDWSVHEETRRARRAMAEAAIRAVDRFTEEESIPAAGVAHLRRLYEEDRERASPHALVMTYEVDYPKKLRRAALAAQRHELIALWGRNQISDEVFRELERGLDYEESGLQSAATQS